jgi:hypothetical protein
MARLWTGTIPELRQMSIVSRWFGRDLFKYPIEQQRIGSEMALSD